MVVVVVRVVVVVVVVAKYRECTGSDGSAVNLFVSFLRGSFCLMRRPGLWRPARGGVVVVEETQVSHPGSLLSLRGIALLLF